MTAQFAFDVAAVLGPGMPVQAQPHQFGNAVLGVEDGAAAGFRGVCGDHRRDKRAGQRVGNRCRIQFGGVKFQIRGSQAAVLRRLARRDMHGPAAFAMDVLGDVGQQREVSERPDDGDGLMDVDAVEHAGQLGAIDLGPSHPERLDARPLDEVEHLLAVLLPDRIAQDRAEEPDVFPHRLGRLAAHLGTPHRTDRCQRDIGDFGHPSSIGAVGSRRIARVLALRGHDRCRLSAPTTVATAVAAAIAAGVGVQLRWPGLDGRHDRGVVRRPTRPGKKYGV